jgi:hypothetical protein
VLSPGEQALAYRMDVFYASPPPEVSPHRCFISRDRTKDPPPARPGVLPVDPSGELPLTLPPALQGAQLNALFNGHRWHRPS